MKSLVLSLIAVFLVLKCSSFRVFQGRIPSVKHYSASFTSSSEYVENLKLRSKLPKGFSVGATRFDFSPLEVANKILPMNLTLIQLAEPTDSFAAVFTANKFPGGPVLVGKDRLKDSQTLQAIVVNNKISNVCPGGIGDRGYADSDSICEAIATALQLPSKTTVFPSSTGIIGWRLPIEAMKQAIPALLQTRQSECILPAALGIMTTDRYPKVRSYYSRNGNWSIVAIAKGAGMIGKLRMI
jgi:glutamate N-acetyltransferase / amino-acid N-acetyltransferase